MHNQIHYQALPYSSVGSDKLLLKHAEFNIWQCLVSGGAPACAILIRQKASNSQWNHMLCMTYSVSNLFPKWLTCPGYNSHHWINCIPSQLFCGMNGSQPRKITSSRWHWPWCRWWRLKCRGVSEWKVSMSVWPMLLHVSAVFTVYNKHMHILSTACGKHHLPSPQPWVYLPFWPLSLLSYSTAL